MKHHAPQFELPATESAFNLAGEIIRQDEAPAPITDNTPLLFVDLPEVRKGQRQLTSSQED